MMLNRRRFIESGVLALAASFVPALAQTGSGRPMARIAQGRLQGLVERGVCVFRGIPYAGMVSSPAARFRAPPPPPSWTGVRDAGLYGAPSIQPGAKPGGIEPAPSEDCLFLNVWTPAPDTAKRPVMVYFHGGGFTIGSGARIGQNGANLARNHDVVVVESNHRLGIFGYLYLGGLLGADYEGNQGLLDLVAALRWVHENIEALGGDPDNVMIFGESGGGGKVSALYGMPSAAPYFHKASIESAIGPNEWSADEATEVTRAMMTAFGLTDPRKLLTLPTAQFLAYQTGGLDPSIPGARMPGQRSSRRDQAFWPMIDKRTLPELPFKVGAPAISAHKPLIVGGCKDEAVFFHLADTAAFSLDEAGLNARLKTALGDRADAWLQAFRQTRPNASPSQLLMAIETAAPWRAHAVYLAERKAAQAVAPVYAYLLDYQSPAPVPGTTYPMGSPHAADIRMKFNNVVAEADNPGDRFNADQTPARMKTSANMGALWASFARTGKPSLSGADEWSPYTLDRRETMLIDAECRLVSDPEGEERTFWQQQAGAVSPKA
ncbi:carboxylesterase family protein [Sphingobium sp. H39-3-25]|uniref:carboxylesterase/lipase family protein n=1 Tax=Sphingobium arseniciresistens TaxID=3030834 RepID=UPI0023B960DA|nr:carboxylesterase family protein [Sphingobium arseniciresistens]